MRTVTEVKADILGCIRRGEHEMEAAYPYENPLNDLQRELIAAFAAERGEAWLGSVNLHSEGDIAKPIWKWAGGLVYNFGARFVIPQHDAELERLILERHQAVYEGTTLDGERVGRIFDRITALGGETLLWN